MQQVSASLTSRRHLANPEKQKAAEAEVRAAPTAPAPKAEPVPPPTAEPTKPETVKPETVKTEEPAAPVAVEPAAQAPVEVKPAPEPTARVETIGGTQPTPLNNEGRALPSGARAAPGADAYGPVQYCDTPGH